MMAKRPNPTIGMVDCPICGEVGAVRKDRAGVLYYVCACGGPHPLHGPKGREFVFEHGTIWGEEGTAPAEAPEWIRQGKGHPPGTRSPFSRPRTPAAAPELGDPAPAPVPELEPVDDDPEPGRMRGGLFV